MMLVALGILLWSLAVPYTAQAIWWQSWWEQDLEWQQEIPSPGPNQIINPEYLKKKQELNDSWNQLQRQNSMARQHARWTRESPSKSRSDSRALHKTISLESELKKIPMYLEQGAPPAPGPEPAGEIMLKY